jgi:hypothetical protein
MVTKRVAKLAQAAPEDHPARFRERKRLSTAASSESTSYVHDVRKRRAQQQPRQRQWRDGFRAV